MALDFSMLDTLTINDNADPSSSNEASQQISISPSQIPNNVQVNVNDNASVPPPITSSGGGDNEDESTSILDNILEIPEGVLSGAEKAVNATLDLGASAISFASDVVDKGWDASEFKDVESPIRIPDEWIPDIDTPTGKIVSDISQFGVEFFGLGKLKMFKAAGDASKLSKYALEMARGATADIMGFKAQTQNLTSDLVEMFPSLDSPIADFLKNDGTDDHITGRLKNALEGAGLGVAVDGIMSTLRCVRSVMKHGKNTEAIARDLQEEVASEAAESTAQEVVQEGTEQTARQATQEAVQEGTEQTVRQATEQVAEEATETAVERSSLLTDPVDHTPLTGKKLEERIDKMFTDGLPKDTPLTETDLLTIHKASVSNPQFFDKLISENVNFRNYAWDTEQGRSLVQGIHLERAKELASSNKYTMNELLENAAKTAEEYGFGDVADSYRSAFDIALDNVEENKKVVEMLINQDLQMRSLIPHMAENINNIAQRILGGTATDSDIVMFMMEGKRIQQAYTQSRDLGSLFSKSLNSRRIMPQMEQIFRKFGEFEGEIPKTLDDMKRMLENNGLRREDIENVARLVTTAGDPARQMAMARTLAAPTWTKQFNFWFTQNILTGINTHLFNIGGNTLKTGLMASERLLGAAMKDLAVPDSHEMRYAMDYVSGLFQNIASAAKLSLAAYKADRSGLETALRSYGSKFTDAGTSRMMLNSRESFDAMFASKEARGETVHIWERYAANMMSPLGIFGRTNAKVMLGEDEFFRQMHFRASQREIISRKLDAAGYKRGSKEWEQAFSKEEKKFFDKNNLIDVTNPDAKSALQTANRSAFAEDITNKSVQKVIEASNNSVILKMAMPFIKTVWNVSVDSAEHIPFLQFMSKDFKASILGKNGAMAQNEALGKLALANGLAITAYCLATNGMIVGALPTKQSERDAMTRAGIKPYSIKIGDTWVSYQRADPVAACLGAMANFVDLCINQDKDEGELAKQASYAVGAFIASLADKSFLSGFHDMLDAVFSGAETGIKVHQWAGRQLASALPASGLVNQVWRNWMPNITDNTLGDNYYHVKSDSIFSGLQDSGYAGILTNMGFEAMQTPIKYDWVTGEPVRRTVLFSEDKTNNFVIDELLREAKGVYGPPQRSIGGVRLTPEEYSRYCELHGTVKIGGKTMMETLDEVMRSDKYDYYRERIPDDNDIMGRTYRGDIIRNVMKQYRDFATQQLYREFPDIQAEINERKIQAKRDRAGVSQGQSLIDSLNGGS